MIDTETFETEEGLTRLMDIDPAATDLARAVGMTGQVDLAEKKPAHPADPYRQMTAVEEFVYRELCPVRTPARDYDKTVIPIRALQVIAHALQLEAFTNVRIWSAGDSSLLVAVGTAKDPARTWMEQTFILARWGRAPLPGLDDMCVRAGMAWRDRTIGELVRVARAVEVARVTIESTPPEHVVHLGRRELQFSSPVELDEEVR